VGFAARVWKRVRSPGRGDPAERVCARQTFPRFAIAFLIAGAFGAAHLLHPGSDVLPITADSAKYHALAQGVERLIHEQGLLQDLLRDRLPSAERDSLGIDRWEFQHAPAYVVPLGIAYAVLPNNAGTGRALALLLYAASAGLIVLLGRYLLGRRLPWVAFAGYLLYLPFLYYGLGIATEPHATFTLLLVCWLLVRFHRRPGRSRALPAGLGLALLFLAKTTFRALAVLILLGEIVALARKRRWPQLGRLALAAVVPVGLWFGALALAGAPLNPLAQTGEQALWLYRGNYVPDQGWETVGLGDALGPELREAGDAAARRWPAGLSEGEYVREMYSRGFRLTLAHYPVEWILLVWKKFGLFWTTPAIKIYLQGFFGAWPVPRWLHALLFPLGLLGVAVAARRMPHLWMPAALVLGVSGIHAVSHLVARYQLPVLPIWFIYALLGSKAILVTGRRLVRRDGFRGVRQLPWGWLIVGVVACLVGGLLAGAPLPTSRATARVLYGIGALLCGLCAFATLPMLRAAGLRVRPVGRYRWQMLWLAPLLFCVAMTGRFLSERDWDQFHCTLDRPGQALVQRIRIPTEDLARAGGVDSAWVEIDMIRSPKGSFRLDLLLQGQPVKTFRDTLEGRYAAFLFDSETHAVQDRYRRVAQVYDSYVRGYLNRRHGDESIGFDYFRRWVKVGIPLEALRADTLEVELRLVEASDGAWVKIYADRGSGVGVAQRCEGPAIGENPFEHSSYRAEFFAGDREKMDARLIRPRTLKSPWVQSLRREHGRLTEDLAPGWGRRAGDLRVRLHLRLAGRMVVREADGQLKRVWTAKPRVGDRSLSADEMRQFQWWRDEFFDGTWVL
jgi:4-amino-4-deoxy-L-arabinose transferase-like glycosyltransferase